MSTIQNIIAENSYDEVSNLNSTLLTASKISGLNQKTSLEECDTVQKSLLIARQKAKKAMFISDLDDDDNVKPNKIKKLKSSIECPVFSENYIDPDQISETVDYIPERDNKNDNYRQSTSYVKSVFDKSPVKMNNGWSPSPLKSAAKDQLRSASKEQISFKEIDSCTKKVISTTVSRKLKFGDKEKPCKYIIVILYFYDIIPLGTLYSFLNFKFTDYNNNIVNFNILSDEETFDTSVIKN
ncbi:uncharacterized protein LOC132935425 [Metopolophium dirhodum]|uniref:uncharacterized protein LOC132935425 n=1 Tax=Metopolophium dirhodum TaxID=44670 RepID=UPI0029907F74|nr:uncharacterized protein LOC132935425 [Metopolophium dirhodum]